MGCFLACFGSSKDRRRRKHRHSTAVFQPSPDRRLRTAGYNPNPVPVPVPSSVSLVRENEKPEKQPVSPVPEVQDESETQSSFGTRKKVTFDTSVRTYEHVPVGESVDFTVEEEEGDNLAKAKQSVSSSETSSLASSVGSYPPNHRYQNCRDSDDEMDNGESDIDDDDDDEDEDEEDGDLDYDDDFCEDDGGSRTEKVLIEEVDSSSENNGLPEREVKPNRNARDRSAYVHPVLNPVENLTQWKAVKGKGAPPKKQQKENLVNLEQEPRMSFSSAPSFKELSFSFRSMPDESKNSVQDVAVDASLSTWLGSSDSTPSINKSSKVALGTGAPEKSMSVGSNSPQSFEDRPILGALTLEEIKQFSASSSPRRSPSRSPDEMPIIGTVGTYWNDGSSGKNSGSASSFKGIPNTTSKYREDKRVNWHSTPFETRLERALNGGATGAYSNHSSKVC